MSESHPEPSDIELIDTVLSGNINEFEKLINRYRNLVCKILASHVPAGQVSELAHETFVAAYRSLPRYRRIKPFQNWLTTITLRCCQDYWRARYRNREIAVSELNEEQQNLVDTLLLRSSDEQDKMAVERQEELHEILMTAMNALSPKERMVLTLIHFEDIPVKEVAERMDMSIINVKVSVFRARRKLRKELDHITKAVK